MKKAPTATDIAGLPDGYYLDLEGEALGETCVYARGFQKLVEEGKAPAVTYAHIAREPNHSGFALQYWFFWYFNQFNDLHEGDWEGMQLGFEAETTTAALTEEPSEIILFQHAGGERAKWGDAKVQKEGSHPVVYPAAGSHATFYDSAVYIQNGQHGSGVGCDNTTEPLRELRPRPVLLPETAPERGKFEWLSYDGRWGEKEKGFNNGPTGPPTKTVWREPFAWMSEQRTTSPRLPGGSIAGPQITGAFCGAVAQVSDFINLEAKSRTLAIVTLAVLALLIALFIGLTRWRPVDLAELRAKRAFGQLIRAARQLYGRQWKILVTIALAGLVIVAGTNLLAGLLAGGGSADRAAGRAGVNLALADLVESIARPIALAVVAAIVIIFMRLLVESRSAGFRACWNGMRERFWRIVAAELLYTLGIGLMAITVIGIPFAIWKLVGWSFVGQEVLFTDRSLRESFRGSTELVRGRWWRAVRVVVFLAAVLFIAGPLLTLGLIFTPLPFLDQPARGACLRPADPLRRDRPDAALLRSPGASGGAAGEPLARAAPRALAATQCPRAPAPPRPRAEPLRSRAVSDPIDAPVDPVEATLEGVEVLVDRTLQVVETPVDHPAKVVEALVDALGEVVDALVGPSHPHRLHRLTVADKTLS